MYVLVNRVSIGSDNGLSPIWRQAIIWTNARLLLIGPSWTNFSEILTKLQNFSFVKMHLKKIDCEMAAILSMEDELMLLLSSINNHGNSDSFWWYEEGGNINRLKWILKGGGGTPNVSSLNAIIQMIRLKWCQRVRLLSDPTPLLEILQRRNTETLSSSQNISHATTAQL